MHIDDFAPNLCFFFSNGMDPEYTVLGRVARRIWAVAMRDSYGANERSQKLKYHVQTSGRSLHAQEIQFNDIRTTLQALIAIYDNCNSLHTNAFDEAITTPTEDSVRRAMAIQLIINREWGLAKNENPNQGAFIIDELTELVEEAVLQEFEKIAERGGVLGAMETGYQRGKIQEESMHYEMLKHTGEYPIIGVNTFRNPHGDPVPRAHRAGALDRRREAVAARSAWPTSTPRHAAEAPAMLQRLQQAVIDNRNVFEVLMDAVRVLLARADHRTRCSRSAGSTGAACDAGFAPRRETRSSSERQRAAMTIILVRHGETLLNAARVLQPAATALSERGLAQAQAVAARLATMQLAGILSSDLPRAWHTAEAIAAATGLPVHASALLRERDFGALRGRRYDELGFDPLTMNDAPPGGESVRAFRRRVASAFAELVALRARVGGPLAVVTHGLVIAAMLERHARLPANLALPSRVANTALTILSAERPHTVERLACSLHLELPARDDGRGLSGG